MSDELLQRLDALRQTHLDAVHQLIEQVVAQDSPANSSLVEMCGYHFETGGKRLRALLPLAVAEALGESPEKLVPFGAACEMLHNATLVHDDLQDGDQARRGAPTIWVKYSPARAINLGDAMFYWALLLLQRLDAPPGVREKLANRLLRETLRVIDGQDREFLLKEMPEPTIEDYFRMVEGKTSGLFSLPVAGAAAFCRAPAPLIEALERAAGHLGVLFQIQDDVLDLYAEKGREHRGTDICEGKISALVAHFLTHASPEKRQWLRQILTAERDLSDAEQGPNPEQIEQIDQVARAFREAGSLQFALDEIARRRALATDDSALADFPALRALLNAIADLFLAPIADFLENEAHTTL